MSASNDDTNNDGGHHSHQEGNGESGQLSSSPMRPLLLLEEDDEDDDDTTNTATFGFSKKIMEELLDDTYCEVVDDLGSVAYECLCETTTTATSTTINATTTTTTLPQRHHNTKLGLDDEECRLPDHDQDALDQRNKDTQPLASAATANVATQSTIRSTQQSSQPPPPQKQRWIRLEKQVDPTVAQLCSMITPPSSSSSSSLFSRQQRNNLIWQQIQKAKDYQSQYGHADLYDRHWVTTTTSTKNQRNKSNDVKERGERMVVNGGQGKINGAPAVVVHGGARSFTPAPNSMGDKKEKSDVVIHHNNTDDKHTFTILQFNTLAEGLSAGPNAKVPFPPTVPAFAAMSGVNGDEATTIKTTKASYFYGGFTNIPVPNVTLDFRLRRWRLLEVVLGGGLSSSNEDDVDHDTDRLLNDELPYDILALEEVDRYGGFWHPLLTQVRGNDAYEGMFCPKLQSPGVRLGWYSDGCAVFWNKSKFALVETPQRMPFATPGTTQVFCLVTLRHLATQQLVVVAVTHLKAAQRPHHCGSHDGGDQTTTAAAAHQQQQLDDTKTTATTPEEQIRVAQVQQLIHEIGRVQTNYQPPQQQQQQQQEEPPKSAWSLPVIVAGDFNADPPPPSVLQALRSSHGPRSGGDHAKDDHPQPEESAIGHLLKHRQPLSSSSAVAAAATTINVASSVSSLPSKNQIAGGGSDDEEAEEEERPFTFQSAYTEIFDNEDHDNEKGGGFYTTWKTRGSSTTKRAIDYIFYYPGGHGAPEPQTLDPVNSTNEANHGDTQTGSSSSSSSNRRPYQLHCRATLSIPKAYELEATKLPGLRYPSDHLAVGAKFELVPTTDANHAKDRLHNHDDDDDATKE
ncbi:hypothetical protein ACA910_015640 [Epithemia clementina (nom. ined.)]